MAVIEITAEMTSAEQRAAQNTNNANLDNTKLDKSGGTVTGDLEVTGALSSGGLTAIGSKVLWSDVTGMTTGTIPLSSPTANFTHFMVTVFGGECIIAKNIGGKITLKTLNIVAGPSTSTYHDLFEARLDVGISSLTFEYSRCVSVASGAYSATVTTDGMPITEVIGLKLY
jgi:hypothetical protein